MKTAVELLESEMQILFYIAKSNKIKFDELIEQAKEMENEQKIEFACKVAEASAEKYIQGKTTEQIAEELIKQQEQ